MISSLSLYHSLCNLSFLSVAGLRAISRVRYRPNSKNPIVPRFYSTQDKDKSLRYIPHDFTYLVACEKFVEEDSKRLFAPRHTQSLQPTVLTESNADYLRKVLLPFFGINATVTRTEYTGEYGYTKSYTTTSVTTDEKGNSQTSTQTHYYTEWHHISGTIGSCRYTQEDSGLCVYAGLKWDSKTIENGMGSWKFTQNLKSFDPTVIEADTHVDPFLKRAAIAQEIGTSRIFDYETQRIRKEIYSRKACDDVSIKHYQVYWDSFNTSSFLLPCYILQYPNCPPRLMPALNKNVIQVKGTAPLSIPKVMTATTIATTILSLFVPQVAVPVRIIAVLVSAASSGAWARYRLSFTHSWQQGSIESERKQNEAVAETIADRKRRQATEKISASQGSESAFVQSRFLDVDPIYFQVLGIGSEEEMTEENIRQAFIKKIKVNHPDQKSGSSHKAQEIIKARDVMLGAIQKRKEKFGEGKRNFSSQSSGFVKQPPRSVRGINARLLIDTVLVQKDYKKALQLVETDQAHPDSHDQNENTLLTEATKIGDLTAMLFAIIKLGAHPDVSCDCPDHLTALHYAVLSGDIRRVKLLLQHKANPNLINSKGETPLDIAVSKQFPEIQTLLISSGGIQHRTIEGSEGFWRKVRGSLRGYGSNDRTRLLGQEEAQKKGIAPESDTVIQLPAPKKEEE